jgi:hypothetical protein
LARKPGTALVSVEALERAMLPAVRESAVAQMAAEPAYATQNIIRVKNQRFLLGEQELKAPVRVVVLGTSFYQAYYDQAYDPENRVPPVCFALADTQDALRHHDTSPKPQFDGPCVSCPQNQSGSGENGGFTRACSGRRRLALLLLDDKGEDPAIGSIEISASGLRPFSMYVKGLAGVQGAPLYLAVTELDIVITKKDTWYVGAQFGGLITRSRPDWVTPPKGVKLGSDGWLEQTIVGKKVREVREGKMLLTPPSLQAPAKPGKKKKGKPVTGAARVSVKDARAARRGKAAA